ncbi:hypothetical protein GDO86_011190 [Hymenochirus boettgeri]|nr:hypothetical protein GDO86_011190 [Hymenochirus boettgeri]
MKVQRKENRGDNIRIKALNVILHRALTDMLHTSEVSQEVCDLNVELSKVSVSVDFSVCRAYWMANGNKDTDSNVEKVLQNYAPCFRHRMLTHQVLGSVPPIVFVRDKEDARIQEVEKLLATAEFGEENENPLSVVDPSASKNLQFSAIASGVPGESMFGIDHADLNKQILEYKRKVKEKMKEADENLLLFKQQEQLAVIRKQKILKRKKQKRFLHDDNDSPQEYLLSRYNNINAVESVSNEIEFDYELQKEIKELKKERPGESKINLSGQS